MVYFVSLFDVNSDVVPEAKVSETPKVSASKISLWITAFAVDTTVAYLNGIKGLRSLTKNPSDLIILDTWVFYNFTVTDQLLAKA